MATNDLRIFLDSNVIISGLFSDKGPPRIILDLLSFHLPGLTGVTGKYNLIEVERNLARKLPRAIPVYQEYLPKLAFEVIPLPTRQEIEKHHGLIVDKDLPVLVSAINGVVDYLVTGDNKDFGKIKGAAGFGFAIVSPAEFLAESGEWLRGIIPV
jgi:predicted nucleic acid-binding protein